MQYARDPRGRRESGVLLRCAGPSACQKGESAGCRAPPVVLLRSLTKVFPRIIICVNNTRVATEPRAKSEWQTLGRLAPD